MTVFCSACDRVHPDTAKGHPWSWRCMAAPVEPEGFGFVCEAYSPNPPYAKCDKINTDGECPMFTPRREKKVA